ncbi:MAG: S9 family peptidase [Alphaproteobacteria bacterium]|nr:S9 family peptidase [Alphaproteobacteria bacterium]
MSGRSFPLTRRAALAGAAFLPFVSGVARGQTPALIPRRTLFAPAERTRASISPDGTRLVWLAPHEGIVNLWLAPLDDLGKARPITRVTDRDISPSYWWLPSGRFIVFFREQAGDENWQAHRVDLASGEIKTLTPGPGVRSFVHQTSRNFPDELLIAHNARDKRYFDVFRYDIASGRESLVYRNDEGFSGLFTDQRFRVRYGQRNLDDGSVEFFAREDQGPWRSFGRVPLDDTMNTRMIEFSDDQRELYWLDSRGRDRSALVAQDLATGATRVLAEDARADIVETWLDPLTSKPLLAMSKHLRGRVQAVDAAYAEDLERVGKAIEGDVGWVSLSDDKRHWITYHERDAQSAIYTHYDRTTKTARPLFEVRPSFKGLPLVSMRPHVVRSRDGLDLVCYLSRPRDAVEGRPGPMVLVVHGGPWGRDEWGLNSTHQWLANRGYSVLSVNYRGSTGFGKAFVNAANMEWGRRMHDDLIDAVDWAIAQKIADPAKVAIYGGSYGGYAALAGATFTPEKFACVVDIFGISSLTTFLDTIPPYWRPWQTVWKTRMGDYTSEAGRAMLRERSPLYHVDRIVRPMLIAQGANDVRVTPSESDQLVAEMQRRKIPVSYVYFSDEGHGFRRVENRRAFTAVAEAFLARHLGGRVEPVTDDFVGSTLEFRAGRDLIPGLG